MSIVCLKYHWMLEGLSDCLDCSIPLSSAEDVLLGFVSVGRDVHRRVIAFSPPSPSHFFRPKP